jgi:spore coat polysaccharide biosynthesis protein SpsF
VVTNVLLISQARSSSTRLPNKVLMKVKGQTLLEIQMDRLKKCQDVSTLLIATTTQPVDQLIVDEANRLNVESFRGSEDDVLDRYYQAAKLANAKWVVRVTSDCPLLDPILVDKVIRFGIDKNVDYTSNIMGEGFPDGQDVEFIKFSALEKAWKMAVKQSEREHVTLYIRNNSGKKPTSVFTSSNFNAPANFSKIRMTVDEEKDFVVIKKLVAALGIDKTWEEYTQYIIEKKLNLINDSITRNEGLLKSLKND